MAIDLNEMTENLQRTLRKLAQRESLSAVGEFAASLAHEVRNPLSSIRVDLQRAAETATDGKSAELVSRALRSVDRLDRTVTGALRVARSGRIAREHIDLGPVVRAAMHSAQPEFRRRDVRLEPWTGDEPLVVSGDPAALEQVFLNLLLNAAEAQDAGGRASITVRKDTGYVTVTVSDNGPGIPANERNRVTEPFYSTKQDGTGLGLSIVRRIVAAHAGDLAIESVPGKGTTVLVRLPAAERNGTAS